MSKSHKRSRKRVSLLPLVANRCDYEQATHWGAYWTKWGVLDYAALCQPPIPTRDLYGAQATQARWRQVIIDNNAIFVCGVGHGNEQVFTGQNEEILLDRGNGYDRTLMVGRYGSFLSCVFGQAAGAFVQAGMLGFFGYSDTYWFLASIFPNSFASPFFMSHFTFDRTLEDGKSWIEAFDAAYKAYTAEIAKADPEMARYLISDRDAMTQACMDPDAGPWKGEVQPPPIPPPPPSTCPIAKATAAFLNGISAVLGRHARFIAVSVR
jgi:hypothetical protein